MVILPYLARISYLISLFIISFLIVLSLPIGYYAMMSGQLEGIDIGINIPFIIFGLPLLSGVRITVFSLFITLSIIYGAIILKAFVEKGNHFWNVSKRIYKTGFTSITDNTIILVCTAFSGLVLVSWGINLFQTFIGIETGSIVERAAALQFTSVSLAPIIEEVGFRVTIIGIVVGWFALYRRGFTGAILAIFVPWSVYIDMEKKEKLVVWLSILLSAIAFGFAHIAFGGGWKIGKVAPALISGIILGWIFLRKGFIGAVILHWLFNYFDSAYRYFEIVTGFSFFSSLVDISIILLGIMTIVLLGHRLTISESRLT